MSSNELQTWFKDHKIAAGGMVNPADSTTFPGINNTNCDFYKWSAQMFLWLTSPSGGGVIFDSPIFYDVVEAADTGLIYRFLQNSPGTPNAMKARTAKLQTPTSTGQAGGSDVLISQAGSITYYGIHVNDVYASYRTSQYNKKLPGPLETTFPTTAADLAAVVGKAAGQTFGDGVALTMELKTSWVDVKSVDDPSQYVLLDTLVPNYTKVSDTEWKLEPKPVEKTLAMVGIHIVGLVQDHPEMVWASYEHVNTAPDAPYYYENTGGQTVTAPYSSAGNWLFIPTGTAQPSTVAENASVDSETGNIVAAKGMTIGPVDVLRMNPWGNEPVTAAQVINPKTVSSNTDLVSLNQSIMRYLGGVGDVRANYIQIGGIWTVKGQIPDSGTDTNLRGGLRLANSTMETFHQYPDDNNGFQSVNCFSCHSTSSGQSINVSHIFDKLQPLD